MAAMRHILALTLAVVLAALVSLPAQASRAAGSTALRRDGQLLFAPVHIDGKGPFWFCVDTGASHTVLDPKLVRRLRLATVGSGTTRGTGTGEVPVEHLGPLTMTVGRARVTVQEPWSIDLSGVPIPRWVEGLIGAELFERYVVELDPESLRLTMYEPARFEVAAGMTAVPLIVRDHRLFVPVTIDVRPGLTVEREARIDSGSESSVSDEIVKEAREVRKSVLGQGLGVDYEGLSGRFDAIRLGPFTLRDVWGPGAPRTGLGMEVLRRFTATFDASRGKLYLRPNRHLAEPVPTPPAP